MVAGVFAFHRLFWTPRAADLLPSRIGQPLSAKASALASLAFSAGLALLTAIAVLHRNRLGFVFRGGRARLVGAIALTFFAPIAVYGLVPWLVGPTIAIMLSIGPPSAATYFALAVALFAFPFCYAISCLLVSGLRHRGARLLGFALVWFSACAFHLLAFGWTKFQL